MIKKIIINLKIERKWVIGDDKALGNNTEYQLILFLQPEKRLYRGVLLRKMMRYFDGNHFI